MDQNVGYTGNRQVGMWGMGHGGVVNNVRFGQPVSATQMQGCWFTKHP